MKIWTSQQRAFATITNIQHVPNSISQRRTKYEYENIKVKYVGLGIDNVTEVFDVSWPQDKIMCVNKWPAICLIVGLLDANNMSLDDSHEEALKLINNTERVERPDRIKELMML